MKKRNVVLVLILAAAIAVSLFGAKSLRDAYLPVRVDPSAEWEPYVSSLDVERELLFVDAHGNRLEAELFIPHGGAAQKPAVVFSPGSGDALYQNYAWGFVETYILDVFLRRDIAVLLVNKPGMGSSEGNYTLSSIEGRADYVYAAVVSIASHPAIDASRVGLVGHSEGGWVVAQAAGDHPEIVFFISLVGPVLTRMEQAIDMYTHEARCGGLVGEDVEKHVRRRVRLYNIGATIGEWTNFGLLGFDARTKYYDPRVALQAVQAPALFVYAEHDNLVSPAINLQRLDEIFPEGVPQHVETVTIDRATHVFRLVDSPCESLEDPSQKEQSQELRAVLNEWLGRHGY